MYTEQVLKRYNIVISMYTWFVLKQPNERDVKCLLFGTLGNIWLLNLIQISMLTAVNVNYIYERGIKHIKKDSFSAQQDIFELL